MRAFILFPCLIALLGACSQENQETPLDIKYKTMAIPASPAIEMDSLYNVLEYVGENPTASGMWDTEPLQSRLKLMLKEEYAAFINTMQAAQPLKRERVLYTMSTPAGPASRDFAFLLVDPEQDRLHVSLVRDGKRQQYQTDDEAMYLPREIRERLRSHEVR